MTQSVVVKEVTFQKVVAGIETTVGREMTDLEKAFVEYAVEQIRLGLV